MRCNARSNTAIKLNCTIVVLGISELSCVAETYSRICCCKHTFLMALHKCALCLSVHPSVCASTLIRTPCVLISQLQHAKSHMSTQPGCHCPAPACAGHPETPAISGLEHGSSPLLHRYTQPPTTPNQGMPPSTLVRIITQDFW